LKLFVKLFETLIKGVETKHFAIFFMLTPLLTINYIKDIAISKEKLIRNSQI